MAYDSPAALRELGGEQGGRVGITGSLSGAWVTGPLLWEMAPPTVGRASSALHRVLSGDTPAPDSSADPAPGSVSVSGF